MQAAGSSSRSAANLIWSDDGFKIVLVGQAPSRDTDGRAPFSGKSGQRLERLAGLGSGELQARFALANVLQRWPGSAGKGDLFPMADARRAAPRLLRALAGRRVVAVGCAVAKALGVASALPDLTWRKFALLDAIAVVPHPSGVNRWWNEPGNRDAAAAFLRSLWPAAH
jgi:uracil-DNA glycosylase